MSGFETIRYQGKEMEPDTAVRGMAILVARNRLHRWWLRWRNPGIPVYVEKWLKWRDIINADLERRS